jgi:hypothetical protein
VAIVKGRILALDVVISRSSVRFFQLQVNGGDGEGGELTIREEFQRMQGRGVKVQHH